MSGGGTPDNQLSLRNGPPADDIQGDILAGFNKDHRMYFMLKFPDQQRGRAWLKALLDQKRIATTRAVATFNERFSAARKARGGDDPQNMKATWVNVSFTFAGLQMLVKDGHALEQDLSEFSEFVEGPVGAVQNGVRTTSRANLLGDTGSRSGPQQWVFGGIDQHGHDQATIHAVLNVQADDPQDLTVELDKMRALAAQHGVVVVFEQRGETLPGDRAGHEHFGFKDGISQPGVEGFDQRDSQASEDPSEVLGQVAGHQGTAIIKAGEFILGMQTEQGNTMPADLNKLGWMKNGSFQVFRRLQQDVPGFWAQITSHVHSFPSDDPMHEELLAAKLVGRWRSGTPIDLAPERDNQADNDAHHDNNFHFFNKDAHGNIVKDAQGNPVSDIDGLRCPRFAHIRKMYPRANNAFDHRIRRIIRRGVPFGFPFDPTDGSGHAADADRGLLFVAYMKSIAMQFEFLQQTWANPPSFPFDMPPSIHVNVNGEPVSSPGPDPIIGTNRADDVATGNPLTTDDQQNAVLLRRDQPAEDVLLNFQRFVHTTGALYSFVPALSTLAKLAEGQI